MEIKVNMECAIKILEKSGFEIEKKAETGSPISANKNVNGKDPDKIELFQVKCNSPYIKFEANIDNEMQQSMINTLNQTLENMVKGAQGLTINKPK